MRTVRSFTALLLLALLASCTHTAQRRPDALSSLPILSRQQWAAQPPISAMPPQTPRFITIHHTATLPEPNHSLAGKLQGLQKFSQQQDTLASGKIKPPWPDVPYHFYIDCHGHIGEGREINYVGDTNTDYDSTGHILIVLEGNFEEEEPTPEQLASVKELVAALARRWHIRVAQIKGHKDYADTLCPGSHLEDQLPGIHEAVAAP